MKTNSTKDDMYQKIRSIIATARLAPSAHNTQAWQVTFVGQDIVVSIDSRYTLTDGDPTGRQAVIGIGIFSEAIRLVSFDNGLQANIGVYADSGVTISFKESFAQRTTKQTSEKLLQTRASDRSIYKPADISKEQIDYLKTAAKGLQTEVHVITEADKINTIADLTSHGIALALTNPEFRKELSQFLLVPWSKKKRGIAVNSLYIPKIAAYFEPLFMAWGIGLPLEVKLERKRWQSASGVIAITAPGDLAKYWFDVGRAYMRLSLLIEDLGLSQATSGAIVEASNYHEDVESILGTSQRIESMIRIGRGVKHKYRSPRIELDELIASN